MLRRVMLGALLFGAAVASGCGGKSPRLRPHEHAFDLLRQFHDDVVSVYGAKNIIRYEAPSWFVDQWRAECRRVVVAEVPRAVFCENATWRGIPVVGVPAASALWARVRGVSSAVSVELPPRRTLH